MKNLSGARIKITGIIQGVGFRPFIYGLASRLNLKGWVRNTSAGVDIELDGNLQDIQAFTGLLREEAPPLARIDSLHLEYRQPDGFTEFKIIHSEPVEGAFQPISPDVCTCDDCLHEMLDPADRRYLYPFINCTNCGPRFTIITDIPYDRPKTTMASFDLCVQCRAEYDDPLDRRFHAQPVACPNCGPQVWLELGIDVQTLTATPGDAMPAGIKELLIGTNAIIQAQKMLLNGRILAIKGLGGFHLACDASNHAAVAELRRRKLRVDKPFAIMVPDISTFAAHCDITQDEIGLILSRQRPIVIACRRSTSSLSPDIAPNQDKAGVMLPYTPLHHLLFLDYQALSSNESTDPACYLHLALVMTSGNLSEEPIATSNIEARKRLSSLADAFLMHNRPIRMRCDDSVIRYFPSTAPGITTDKHKYRDLTATMISLRRSRGYSPDPILLPWNVPLLLATGAELKNAFCLTRERYAFLSHHIGDMENYETFTSFEDGIHHFEKLFRIQPEAIACDLHPDYLATRYAQTRSESSGLPAFAVQHHHAHIAACMAEHNLVGDQPVIGVAFDGTGYGDDGAIWGGEFLVADYLGYRRFAHLKYIPLPGGDASIRKPARTALAHLWAASLDWDTRLAPVTTLTSDEHSVILAQLEHSINAPSTSSMGRLFDAAAALAGGCQIINYEAQAAIEFESVLDPNDSSAYEFSIYKPSPGSVVSSDTPFQIDPHPLWVRLIDDVYSAQPIPNISARFHNAVASLVYEICLMIESKFGINQVVLSGGVWQNISLLSKTYKLLQDHGFTVLIHNKVPANDGGIALGQVCVVASTLRS